MLHPSRILGSLLATLFACLIVCAPATSQEAKPLSGVALVIGNGDYAHLTDLPNPANDADAIEALLSDLGFESVRRANREAADLERDLDRFVEDAANADVAVLYYSGHGIEAGGENYLVPVDADFSALNAAGEKLVPLSALTAKLQASVPVTILLLDACRNNPFPPGATLVPASGGAPVAVTASGLGGARGVTPINAVNLAEETFGTVLAFAAEPGKAALDGDPGANSPYAAAILRHLDAMAGQEFSTVMRMVAEEVYLKTGGHQRPWVNESLRRLLYFGSAPEGVAGEEGEILTERRQLLLTIAALPDFGREQVERVAASGGVPMDALYGMLRALGHEAPGDPGELERLLQSQAEKLKQFLSEREALESSDPEIVRLSALADDAVGEGALRTATRLHEEAKARIVALEPAIEDAESNIRNRRVEFAAVYAKSAETYGLAFEHLKAAEDYARAFEQVKRWDDKLAWRYKNDQAGALTTHGSIRGDNDALRRAIVAAEEAAALSLASGDRDARATSENNLGFALLTLGARQSNFSDLSRAVIHFEAALEVITREGSEHDWVQAQSNLGTALTRIGERESGSASLQRAVEVYEILVTDDFSSRHPRLWGMTQFARGSAILRLAQKTGSRETMEEAVSALQIALSFTSRSEDPLDWGTIQNNLGLTLASVSAFDTNSDRMRQALVAYGAAREELTRERTPMAWAAASIGLGGTKALLAIDEADVPAAENALTILRAALEVATRTEMPVDWAFAQANIGLVQVMLAEHYSSLGRAREAVVAYDLATLELTRENNPTMWSMVRHNCGIASYNVARLGNDVDAFAASVVAFEDALTVRTPQNMPIDWAQSMLGRGVALAEWGWQTGDLERVRIGRDSIQTGVDNISKWGVASLEQFVRKKLVAVDRLIAEMEAQQAGTPDSTP